MKGVKTITDLLLSGPTDENAERKQEGIPNAEIVEEIQELHKRVQVLESLVLSMRHVYPQVINPPLVDYNDAQNTVIECNYQEMRAKETRRIINELRAISEKSNPPE